MLTKPVHIGDASVLLATAVRDFAVYIDADFTTRSYVTNTLSTPFLLHFVRQQRATVSSSRWFKR